VAFGGGEEGDLFACGERTVVVVVEERRSKRPKGGGYEGPCDTGTTTGPLKGLKKIGAQCSVVTFCGCGPTIAFSGTATGAFAVLLVVAGVIAVGSFGSRVVGSCLGM